MEPGKTLLASEDLRSKQLPESMKDTICKTHPENPGQAGSQQSEPKVQHKVKRDHKERE